MAERIERFSTVAGVGVSNQSVAHNFLDGQVTHVHLYVPDGHAGLTAWRLFFGDQQLVPFTAGNAVVANDREFDWDLDSAPIGTGYNSVISNSDVYAHSFHVEIWIDPTPLTDGGSTDAQLPILLISF